MHKKQRFSKLVLIELSIRHCAQFLVVIRNHIGLKSGWFRYWMTKETKFLNTSPKTVNRCRDNFVIQSLLMNKWCGNAVACFKFNCRNECVSFHNWYKGFLHKSLCRLLLKILLEYHKAKLRTSFWMAFQKLVFVTID